MVCETWQPYTHRETLQITSDREHTVQPGFSESRKVYQHIVVISSYLASIILLEQFIWHIMHEHGDATIIRVRFSVQLVRFSTKKGTKAQDKEHFFGYT
jgi:hypothetical protein